ncbi:MAG TPA: ABC transporter ATP-binding protein [Stellaceae bacterium]|nr:ABC transporter ATP-binding protein [Stellaceae bacterium]
MSSRIVVDRVAKVFPVSSDGRGGASLRQALFGLSPPVGQREIRAVDGVSFSLQDGERLGIIGRNGAGKSTLLNLIAGLTPPSAGRIDVRGKVHAIMTLGTVLRDEATGRENIYLDGAVQNFSRDEIGRTIERIIAFSELGEFIDRPVHTYSSGMKARLAFSMIAFIEAEILIIDEALSVGDARFAAKAGQRMKALSAAGRIVILVSHGLSSLVELCSRCIWMDSGKILMDGEPKKVAAAYQRAVTEADEIVLRSKFGGTASTGGDRTRGELLRLSLSQPGREGGGAVLLPLEETIIDVRGRGTRTLRQPNLRASITRIDGVLVWREDLPDRLDAGRLRCDFRVALRLGKLSLGESLYRLDVTLFDADEAVAVCSTAFEVRDEEGQVGGRPMIFQPLIVDARAATPVDS